MSKAAIIDATVQELHAAITQALGCVAYLVGTAAHDARTFSYLLPEEEERRKPGEPNVSERICDKYVILLRSTLAGLSDLMNALGDAQEEPEEDDMAATDAAFGRVRRVLAAVPPLEG